MCLVLCLYIIWKQPQTISWLILSFHITVTSLADRYRLWLHYFVSGKYDVTLPNTWIHNQYLLGMANNNVICKYRYNWYSDIEYEVFALSAKYINHNKAISNLVPTTKRSYIIMLCFMSYDNSNECYLASCPYPGKLIEYHLRT